MGQLFTWVKYLHWKKAVLAGVIYTLIGQILHMLGAQATMSFYTNQAYSGVWSKLMMPKAGPPPPGFYYYSLAFSWVTGFIFAVFYDWIKPVLPAAPWKRIYYFVSLLVALSLVPGYLSMILLINLPLGLVVYWFVESVIIYALATLAFIRVFRS